MMSRMQRLFTDLFTGFFALSALLLCLFTVYLCYALEWHGPMRDLWEFVGGIQQQLNGHWDWNYLLQPYGGIHRIFLPKLLFYLDYRYAAGSNLLSLSVSLLMHLAAAALLIRSVWISELLTSAQEKILLAATVLWCFASTTQLYNLIYNSDNQVVISNALAVLAAWLFAARRPVLAHLLVLLACLSHSSSLMLLPAFTLLLWAEGKDKKWIGLQILFSFMLLLLYVSGRDPLENPQGDISLWQQAIAAVYNVLTQIPGLLRYIGLHLASPASRLWPTWGILLSYSSIIFISWRLWRFYRRPSPLSQLEFFCLALALYGICIALITASGRQMYPNSALTDRYQTLVMTYWAAVLILLYLDLRQRHFLLALVAPLLSLCLLLPHQYSKALEMGNLSSRVEVAHTAATVGITDMDTIAATLSHPLLMDGNNLVAEHNDFLRAYGLGYFSQEAAEFFLNPAAPVLFSENIELRSDCQGTLLSLEAIDDGAPGSQQFRFSGLAQVAGRPVTTVLVLDAQGQAVGLGRPQRPRDSLLPATWQDAADSQWLGFIHSHAPLQLPLTVISYQPGASCELFSIANL